MTDSISGFEAPTTGADILAIAEAVRQLQENGANTEARETLLDLVESEDPVVLGMITAYLDDIQDVDVELATELDSALTSYDEQEIGSAPAPL